jgi:hypothetical protein
MGMMKNKTLPKKEILLKNLDNLMADLEKRGSIVQNGDGEWVVNPSLLVIPQMVRELGLVGDINSSSEASSPSQSVSSQDIPQSPGPLLSPEILEEEPTKNADEGPEIEKCTPDPEEEPLS